MLILSHRPHEQIRIAGNITVTLLSIQGNKAVIGIDAPRDVAVDREEVHEHKQRQKQVS